MVSPMIDQSRVDEIRKKIQAAKDALFSEIMIRADRRVFTPLINKLVDDVRSLEVRLIEAERVILKPCSDFESLRLGQEYYLLCKKGVSEMTLNTSRSGKETQSMVVGVIDKQIFIPVGEPNE